MAEFGPRYKHRQRKTESTGGNRMAEMWYSIVNIVKTGQAPDCLKAAFVRVGAREKEVSGRMEKYIIVSTLKCPTGFYPDVLPLEASQSTVCQCLVHLTPWNLCVLDQHLVEFSYGPRKYNISPPPQRIQTSNLSISAFEVRGRAHRRQCIFRTAIYSAKHNKDDEPTEEVQDERGRTVQKESDSRPYDPGVEW
ncbi:hypothetical protein C8R44DRAFT_737888 [Mycena epipterygia]|nr:hypothetical protein C8R44DRAFT_737888 [Mycena epipterygia]